MLPMSDIRIGEALIRLCPNHDSLGKGSAKPRAGLKVSLDQQEISKIPMSGVHGKQLVILRRYKRLQRVCACPECGRPAALDCAFDVFDFVVDQEKILRPKASPGFYTLVKACSRL